MSLRTDSLAENVLAKKVDDLKALANEVKSAQRSGSSNIIMNRVATGNAVDFHVTVTYNTIQVWEITFTPTNRPFSNSGFIWHTFFNASNLTGSGSWNTVIEQIPSATSVQVYRLYMMGLISGQSNGFDVQLVMYAIGNGTITIARII